MDRKVFMVFDDFVTINTELLERTGLSLYRSEHHDDPFVRVERPSVPAWRAVDLLMGKIEDEERVRHRPSANISRDEQVGFVRVRYGGDDEDAIGATLYLADGSDTTKLVTRELNKLLKKYAHKDVVNELGTVYTDYYWTDAALASGKNWHLFLGKGVRKERNKNLGYRPKPT
ncbi:hypothetical protein [Paraburkholderia antibiotica]|uniref:Uncharacterized protein n=1 Tax=Paraburkholderia antibiotica TaxID=2728839 RepID=A0A7Y0A312_9BURK|nr:hypothetical protein [Paraburkholderia antibiotica]NML35541.1 hypothetical protein [Paraburkholderia antibiotica]